MHTCSDIPQLCALFLQCKSSCSFISDLKKNTFILLIAFNKSTNIYLTNVSLGCIATVSTQECFIVEKSVGYVNAIASAGLPCLPFYFTGAECPVIQRAPREVAGATRFVSRRPKIVYENVAIIFNIINTPFRVHELFAYSLSFHD